MYSFRKATSNDYIFLYELNVSTMKKYVEQTWGWDDKAQQEYFKSKFVPDEFKIIVENEKDIGVVSIIDKTDEIFIDLIEIIPEYQNKGLGTAILKDIIKNSKTKDCILKLQVLKVNPVISLYKRLGFNISGETKTHFIMEHLK